MKLTFVSLLASIQYVISANDGTFTNTICFTINDSSDPTKWTSEQLQDLNIQPNTIKQVIKTDKDTYYCGILYPQKGSRSINEDTEDPRMEELRKNKKISWIEQETRRVRVIKTADTHWNDLWHLNDAVSPSMKVAEVWNTGVTGLGVLIAILDDGLQTDHTDFDSNVNTADDYDYVDDDNDPSPGASDSHGTNVAGFIAAERNNNDCTVGVAYGSKILGVRILGGDGLTDAQEAQALSHDSSNVDIYSNSWGPTDGHGFSGPGTLTKAALENQVQNGRGGKGAIYTWASGNGGTRDNCNADGYTNSIYTIAITSVEIGQNAWYSEVCAAAMAATYGGSQNDRYLTTTTTSSGCTSDGIQGTSYSTPIASGIIALTLEANPSLTWRDIQHLIVLTTTRNGFSDSYSDWDKNGFGKEFSQVLGFGLMDAEAMVSRARNWILVPTQQNCTLSAQTGAGSTSGSASRTQTKVVTSSDCSTITYLEHVTVEIDFNWTKYRGVTEINLISPSGTETHLLHYRYNDATVYTSADTLKWTFMSVHFWRENPLGTWTLKFKSYQGLSIVTVNSWYLTFYGTSEDPLPNIDLCTVNICQNNGTCTNYAFSYSCTCTDDYTGTNCETVISESESEDGSNIGRIIGIFIGVFIGVIVSVIIAVVMITICYKKKTRLTVAPQKSSQLVNNTAPNQQIPPA